MHCNVHVMSIQQTPFDDFICCNISFPTVDAYKHPSKKQFFAFESHLSDSLPDYNSWFCLFPNKHTPVIC